MNAFLIAGIVLLAVAVLVDLFHFFRLVSAFRANAQQSKAVRESLKRLSRAVQRETR
jgi:hypothetical protein